MTGATSASGLDAAALLARLTACYESNRHPERAGAMAAYMRHQFAFVGLGSTERRALDRSLSAGLAPPREADLDQVARACWALNEREYQYFAADYLRRWVPRLPASAGFLGTARHLITSRSWWDTVDDLATHVVGPLVALHPELVSEMDRWIESDNIWLARSAILHQCGLKQRTDADRLFRYCLRRAGDREFFIRKAIGWALRDYSKADGEAVASFVTSHGTTLSPLSRREALARLNRRPPPAART